MKRGIKGLLCLMLLLPIGGLRAQTKVPCVVVEKSDSTRAEFLLTDVPRVACADNVVRVTTNAVSLEIPVDEVVKVYLAETDVTKVSDIAQPVRYAVTADGIHISGLPRGGMAGIYDTDGRLLAGRRADDKGNVVLQVRRKLSGVFVVKAGTQSFKIKNMQ